MGKYLQTKLKTIHYHQKHGRQIIFNQEKLTYSRPLLRSLNAFNVYQINLYQHLKFIIVTGNGLSFYFKRNTRLSVSCDYDFMHKVSNNVAPIILHYMLKKPSHKYPTNFSHNNFSLNKCSLNSTKYSILSEDHNYGKNF